MCATDEYAISFFISFCINAIKEVKIKGVCEVANDNAEGQIIVSGDIDSIKSLQKILKENKKKFIEEGGNIIDFNFSHPQKKKFNTLSKVFREKNELFEKNRNEKCQKCVPRSVNFFLFENLKFKKHTKMSNKMSPEV